MIFDTFSLLTGTVHRPRVHRTGFNEAYATILSPRSRTRSDHNPIFPEDRIINATPKRLRKPAFRIVGPCITRLWRCVEREREREDRSSRCHELFLVPGSCTPSRKIQGELLFFRTLLLRFQQPTPSIVRAYRNRINLPALKFCHFYNAFSRPISWWNKVSKMERNKHNWRVIYKFELVSSRNQDNP